MRSFQILPRLLFRQLAFEAMFFSSACKKHLPLMVLAVMQEPFTVNILVKKLLNLSDTFSPLAYESYKIPLPRSRALLLRCLPARRYCLARLINILALSSKGTASRERQSVFRILIHSCSKRSGGNGELKPRYNGGGKMREIVVCAASRNSLSVRID